MIDSQFAPPSSSVTDASETSFWATLTIAMLVGFAVTLLLFAMVYVRDLRMLAETPQILWDFICGRPREGSILVPMLILLSMFSFSIACAVWAWSRLHRQSAQTPL